jgi:CRP-like cAMP-binding protein
MEIFKKYLREHLHVPIDEIDMCNARITARTIAKNDFIARPGNLSGYTYFVERGVLRMYTISDNGKEHALQFAPELWLLADRRSTYMKKPSAFYIQAVEDSDVVFIEQVFIDELVKRFPKAAEKITLLLHRHIYYMQHRISRLLSSTAEELYRDFMDTYPQLANRLPQYMIASFLGVTPESLSRVRAML